MPSVLFRNFDQLVQRCVYYLLARSARPLVTDHAPVVDHIKRRRGGEVPLRCNWPRTRVARIDKGPPVDLLLLHDLLELLRLEAADVDADEGEGLVFQVRHERPLVGPLAPSGQSDVAPEIEQHHLPAIVTQLEALAVLVLTVNVRGFLADTQVANPEQLRAGQLPDRVAAGELDIAVLLRGLLEDSFDFLEGLVAILP